MSSNGVSVRTEATTNASKVGGIGRGAVLEISETASADGYTWGKISSVVSKGTGDWGSNVVGNWVALDFCDKI